ncbi:MAG: response regulator [Candidatus Thermoplasmatota archaeon]|jgi:DNA-binding response OmpR family regulator|nr:response regulator [Candidatus Thermoplasmatota archaeon]
MKTILVVDDEPDVRDTIRIILEKKGYRVITAIDGEDCLSILREEKPDLILLDIMMPGIPVRDVIKEIKNIKIAFLSVVRSSEAEKQDLLNQENIVDFIQKPFDVEDLIKRVDGIIYDQRV